jgi:glycogen(starch) synthase
MAHFFPSYPFDLDETLYFFTSGRFEPRNKGFDLCLESMARLNAQLKAADLGVTVVFFIISEQPTESIDPCALQGRGVLEELREVAYRITQDVGERFFRRGATGERVRLDDLVEEYWLLRFRRTQHALRTEHLPLVVTHILQDEANDPVLDQIRVLGLQNKPEDPVKIVYHPQFITSVNPLWGIEYEQFVRGCHLGIFPSAYEPWGYTPLECMVMGVPAVTSDLAGFGRHVAEAYPDHDRWGLNLLPRRGRSFHEASADLTQRLLAFCRLDRRGRVALRNELEQHAVDFEWSKLGKAYHHAHDIAIERKASCSPSSAGERIGR